MAAGEKADLAAINRGRLRHPVYGRPPWVIQSIRPGFVDRVMEGVLARRAQREFLQAVDEIRAYIRRAG